MPGTPARSSSSPPTRLQTTFDSRVSQYEKERLERIERRSRATVQASIASSASLPALQLSKQAGVVMAYNDPMGMPGPSKMQRLIQSDLQELRQEIATSEARGQAWVEREEKRTQKLEQLRTDEEELDRRVEMQKQRQRTRTELEELVLALTEQVRQLVHQSAGVADRARAEAWAEARGQLAAAEAKGKKRSKALKAELDAALEAKRQAESMTLQAQARQEQMADQAETAEAKRATDKMRVAGLYLSRNTVFQVWGRWRADWEAEVKAAKAHKHEQALATAP